MRIVFFQQNIIMGIVIINGGLFRILIIMHTVLVNISFHQHLKLNTSVDFELCIHYCCIDSQNSLLEIMCNIIL